MAGAKLPRCPHPVCLASAQRPRRCYTLRARRWGNRRASSTVRPRAMVLRGFLLSRPAVPGRISGVGGRSGTFDGVGAGGCRRPLRQALGRFVLRRTRGANFRPTSEGELHLNPSSCALLPADGAGREVLVPREHRDALRAWPTGRSPGPDARSWAASESPPREDGGLLPPQWTPSLRPAGRHRGIPGSRWGAPSGIGPECERCGHDVLFFVRGWVPARIVRARGCPRNLACPASAGLFIESGP